VGKQILLLFKIWTRCCGLCYASNRIFSAASVLPCGSLVNKTLRGYLHAPFFLFLFSFSSFLEAAANSSPNQMQPSLRCSIVLHDVAAIQTTRTHDLQSDESRLPELRLSTSNSNSLPPSGRRHHGYSSTFVDNERHRAPRISSKSSRCSWLVTKTELAKTRR
jgi:hypothetical protein